MKTTGIVWSLWALFLFYGGYQTDADGVETPSEQRRAGSGRKRSRTSGSVSSFRSDQQHQSGNIPMPVDPLFSDQREIRLTFSKDRQWNGHDAETDPPRRNKANQKKKPSKSYGSRSQSSSRVKKPNIILMVTDDQDVELGSLDFMPKTRAILKEGGSFFPNSFVSTPMCCPSRSSMLTGLFVHNHGVLTNNDNCSSAYWQAEHEPRTFGAYLAGAGYRTGYFGKYLNKYNGSYVPPGWREWAGQVMNSRYYNYTVNVNGQKIKHGADYQTDYYPDLITNDSISFLRTSKQHYDHQPFLMVMSFPSPHGPEDSAPQYSNLFFNVTRHRTPSYDFAPNPDKQWILRWLGKMKPVHHRFTDLLMTKRLQTLQSVDEAVERVFSELVALGQLDNTYIFYTSDHGYHLGQFGLIKGKSFPFESDVRVPFLVRGPGVGRGRVVQSLIGNVDLAPTFLEIAGLPIPSHMDGASIFRFFQKEKVKSQRTPWRDSYLIERGKMPPANFPRLNVVEDVPLPSPPANPPVQHSTSGSNEGAEGDDADGVSVDDYTPPLGKFERWAVECRKPQYQSPCTGFQKYECVFVEERWRMKKCHHHRPSPGAIQKLRKKWCKCKALSKYRLSKLEPEERRMQRAFLKEHTSVDWRGYRPRFLKTVAAGGAYGSTRSSDGERLKRETSSPDNESSGVTSSSGTESSSSTVLEDVAEDELEQVELIMEDISEEISDLEALTEERGNVTDSTEPSIPDVVREAIPSAGRKTEEPLSSGGPGKLNCEILGKEQRRRINCSSEVYSDPATWRLSRDYLEQQIRVLRVQLDELKVIRKHLRAIRPSGERNSATSSSIRRKVKSKSTTEAPLLPLNGWSSNVAEDEEEEDHHRDEESDGNHRITSPDEEDDDDESNPPPETIQVTIYDNRKIKKDKSRNGPLGLCPCVNVDWSPRSQVRTEERQIRQASRRRMKEERAKRRQKKLSRKRAMVEAHGGDGQQCGHDKMNCFSHDNEHWRTAPFWREGPFCVCMNANNNTYWCIRTLNASHNSLYCEFITGFVTYYDMRIDPYQLRNIAHTLSESQLSFFHQTLERLRVCKGADCFVNSHIPAAQHLLRSNNKADPDQNNKDYHLQSSHLIYDSQGRTKPRRDGYWRRSKRRERSPFPVERMSVGAAV